jgi:putative nucleotidyltransferase with HDIG domain
MTPTKNPTASHILVVDDEEAIRDFLHQGIEMAGYHCTDVGSAAEALEVLAVKPVDVVVSDISMPQMDGLELVRIIKEKYDAEVIIMTGMVQEYTYEDIIAKGANDFIHKPIRVAEFIARLKRVLAERAILSERNRAVEDLSLNLTKFKDAMDGIVQAMCLTVEMKDPYTAGHQQRVADLACAIALEMGLSQDRRYGLRMAGIIHDLGKIIVPTEILCKPGNLTGLEYELIKSHVQAGYDIMKKVEFPWPLADIILQHHERLDGSGYPHGLKGDEIMLEASLIAVADVFETIASHRPYRPSLGLDKAVEEIERNQGRLYHPEAVKICLQLIEEKRFFFEDLRGSFSQLNTPLETV